MIISFIAALIVMAIAAYIDQKERIVPNWLSLGAMGFGIGMSMAHPEIHNANNWWQGGLSALADVGVVILLMCWQSALVEKIFNVQSGLGGGDIKILGAMASILNFKIVILMILIWPVFELMHYAYLKLKNFDTFSIPGCPGMFFALFSSIFLYKLV